MSRELGVLREEVAKAKGWTLCGKPKVDGNPCSLWVDPDDNRRGELPDWPVDMNCAMELVNEMRKAGLTVRLHTNDSGAWVSVNSFEPVKGAMVSVTRMYCVDSDESYPFASHTEYADAKELIIALCGFICKAYLEWKKQ